MSAAADRPAPEESGPLARARALAPLLAAAAPRMDATQELPEEVVAALHEAGMFRLLLPARLGGAALPPHAFVPVIEALAMADASVAWVICQGSGCSLSAGWLGPEVAREVFDGPRAALAWGTPGAARAVPTAGGFRVTGRWSFASGGRHASWLGGHCIVTGADGAPRPGPDGRPVERTMLFPRTAARMDHDWRVIGLRGTGSDAYAVEDLFVPHDHTLARDDPAERRDPAPVYRFVTNTIYASGFAGVALGIARTMLADFMALARRKTPSATARALRDSPVVQAEVAGSEARLLAARCFLLDALRAAWDSAPHPLTLDQRVRIRLAASHASREARAVAEATYHAAGATAIFEDQPFERRFRDIHAVSQQVQARQSHFETVGRHLFGLDIDMRFV